MSGSAQGLLIVSLSLLTVACASTAHRDMPTAALPEFPARFGGETEGSVQEVSPLIESAWWETFGEPQLGELITEALAANLDLKVAAARVEAAAAQARIAGAERKPTLGVSGRGGRNRQNFIGLPVPGGQQVLSTTTSSAGVSLDASWEVDLWGRLRAGKRASLADLAAVQAELRGARESLAGQVAKAWFALLEARAQTELASTTRASYEESVRSLRHRYEAGLVGALDLRLALSDLAGAEAAVALGREREDGVVRQLETLLGRYPSAGLRGVVDLPACPPAAPTGLPAQLVSRRPDLVAAEARVAASDARVAQARRALYPSLTLTASGGTASDSLGDLLDGSFRTWSLVGNLLAPLFNGGRLRAGVSLAEAGENQALGEFAVKVLAALSEVETALSRETFLAEREAALARDLHHAVAARVLADRQYEAGLIGIITSLTARRRALSAESLLLGARRQRLDTRVDLHLALGGGFPETPTQSDDSSAPQEGHS